MTELLQSLSTQNEFVGRHTSHLESGELTNLLSELNWPCPKRVHFELTERIPVKDTAAQARVLLTGLPAVAHRATEQRQLMAVSAGGKQTLQRAVDGRVEGSTHSAQTTGTESISRLIA